MVYARAAVIGRSANETRRPKPGKSLHQGRYISSQAEIDLVPAEDDG